MVARLLHAALVLIFNSNIYYRCSYMLACHFLKSTIIISEWTEEDIELIQSKVNGTGRK